MSKQEELIKLLISEKNVSPEKLEELRKTIKEGADFENVLVEKKIIDIEELTKLKAKIFNLPYKFLVDVKVPDIALYTIPIEVAENYKIICFENEDKNIKVGLTDAENFKAIEAVNFLGKETHIKVEYFLISLASFDFVFKEYRTLNKEISTMLKYKEEEEKESLANVKKEEGGFEEITKSAPVAKIVSVIIRHAVEGRASDIHIEPLPNESRVRYRIDSILHTSLVLPLSIHSAIVARIKVMANLKLDETRVPQDGRIRISVNNKEIDLRISILPLINEEKVVMRILDITKGAPTLESLGFIGKGLEVIYDNIKKTHGMFLVTGPTGSGKSTTIFSILNRINKDGENIVTLEDPVEYYVKGANQSQVRPEVGYTFASGLRSFLRQDPDIIMVGEIRDNETAELAIHASLTGHFVLSTLHTNDAIGAIPRLLDMKVESFLLGSTLNAVVAQRLGRKICPHCKVEYRLPKKMMDEITETIKEIPEEIMQKMLPDLDLKKIKLYKGQGCPRCGNSGYMDRIAFTEVLDITDDLRNIIVDSEKIPTMEDVKKSQQFITIKQDGVIKVLMGLTTMDEVLRTIND